MITVFQSGHAFEDNLESSNQSQNSIYANVTYAYFTELEVQWNLDFTLLMLELIVLLEYYGFRCIVDNSVLIRLCVYIYVYISIGHKWISKHMEHGAGVAEKGGLL